MSYRYSKTKIDTFFKEIWYKECSFETAKSSGPWGQNVNKRETKVQLSRDRKSSKTLPEQYHQKFNELYSNLLTNEWILRLDAQIHRTQDTNKELLHKKLMQMIYSVFKPPKAPRKMTTPPKYAVDARISEKKRRSKTRAMRKVIV